MNEEREVMIPRCPQCGGEGGYMGNLGSLDWFRCVQCGWEFSQEAEEKEG